MVDTVAVSYYRDTSVYPNMGRRSGSSAADSLYWHHMAVLFATVRRHGGAHRLVVATNASPPPEVAPVLRSLDVEYVAPDFRFAPPEGFTPVFGGALYFFDLLRSEADRMGGDDTLTILDPDCVVVRPLDAFVARVRDEGVVLYEHDVPVDYVMNGLDRRGIGRVLAATGRPTPSDPVWIGGEVAGFTAEGARRSVDALDAIWAEQLARHAADREHLRTMEHLLSGVVVDLGLRADGANDHARRIWTAPGHRNVSDDLRDELALTVWHLPAEKRAGLIDLFDEIRRPHGPFWTLEGDAFRWWLAGRLGLRRGPRRRVRDASIRAGRRVRDTSVARRIAGRLPVRTPSS